MVADINVLSGSKKCAISGFMQILTVRLISKMLKIRCGWRDFAPPAEPFLVSKIRDATQFSFFEFPVGWIGIAHPAPRRQYFAVVQGAIEITASDGESRIAKLGDVVLAEDTNSKGHITKVISEDNFIAALTQLE